MTYRSYRPDRRFKRRRWALIVLTLVAVVAAIVYLVSRETEQRGTVEFLAAADEATAVHAATAMELESALSSIGTLTRQDLIGRLDRMTTSAAEADAMLEIEVPAMVAEQYGSLRTASAAWVDGLVVMEQTLVQLMDGEDTESGATGLEESFNQLRAGDAAYALFLESLAVPIEGVDFPSFPAIVYVNPDAADAALYNPTDIMLNVLSSYELAPHHNVAVTGQLDPTPVGDRGGIPLVPFSESISVAAVVSNTGNEVAPVVSVELEILNADTGTTETLTQSIADLEGGASASVTFADLSIEPESLYQVKLTVTIDGDSRPEDDTWDLRFIRNGEA